MKNKKSRIILPILALPLLMANAPAPTIHPNLSNYDIKENVNTLEEGYQNQVKGEGDYYQIDFKNKDDGLFYEDIRLRVNYSVRGTFHDTLVSQRGVLPGEIFTVYFNSYINQDTKDDVEILSTEFISSIGYVVSEEDYLSGSEHIQVRQTDYRIDNRYQKLTFEMKNLTNEYLVGPYFTFRKDGNIIYQGYSRDSHYNLYPKMKENVSFDFATQVDLKDAECSVRMLKGTYGSYSVEKRNKINSNWNLLIYSVIGLIATLVLVSAGIIFHLLGHAKKKEEQ